LRNALDGSRICDVNVAFDAELLVSVAGPSQTSTMRSKRSQNVSSFHRQKQNLT